MSIGPAIVVGVGVLAGLATIATVLGFKLDGPRLLAGLRGRIQASRRDREELRKKVDDQAEQIAELKKQTSALWAAQEYHLKSLDGLRDQIFVLNNAFRDLRTDAFMKDRMDRERAQNPDPT